MSARAVLEKWSREVITHEVHTGSNAYGQRLYGAPVSLRARLDHATNLVRNAQGEEVVSSTQVYLSTTLTIDVLDRITLPDGSTPLLLRVDRQPDHTGAQWLSILYFS